MKNTRYLVIAVAVSLAVAGSSAVFAQSSGSLGAQPSVHLELQICNKTFERAYVAWTSSDGGEGWIVEGWRQVEPRTCKMAKRIRKGNFYVYAEAQEFKWEGHDVRLCVQYPGPFERKNLTGYTCQNNEKLKGFTKFHSMEDEYTVNLNQNQ